MDAGVLGRMLVRFSMLSSLYCVPAVPGPICPGAIPRARPVTTASKSGSSPAYSRRCGRNSLVISMPTGWIDLRECFIDGTFAPAKRGGAGVGKTKKGKGSKMMAVVEADGLPIAITVDSANPHEVKLVKQTLEARFLEALPERLIGDNAYDSDALDASLATQGVEVI